MRLFNCLVVCHEFSMTNGTFPLGNRTNPFSFSSSASCFVRTTRKVNEITFEKYRKYVIISVIGEKQNSILVIYKEKLSFFTMFSLFYGNVEF